MAAGHGRVLLHTDRPPAHLSTKVCGEQFCSLAGVGHAPAALSCRRYRRKKIQSWCPWRRQPVVVTLHVDCLDHAHPTWPASRPLPSRTPRPSGLHDSRRARPGAPLGRFFRHRRLVVGCGRARVPGRATRILRLTCLGEGWRPSS